MATFVEQVHTDVDRAQSGDTQAFSRLVERYQNAALAVAMASIRDVAASHDVAQEAFLQAWRGIKQLRNVDSFGPWLLQLVRREALQSLRSQQRAQQRQVRWMALSPTSVDPSVALDAAEDQALVRQALELIESDAREVLLLYYCEGQSTQQVAQLLSLSDAGVRKRLERAREALRERFDALAAPVQKTLPRAGLAAAVFALIEAAPAQASPPAIGASTVALTAATLAAAIAITWSAFRLSQDQTETPAQQLTDGNVANTAAPLARAPAVLPSPSPAKPAVPSAMNPCAKGVAIAAVSPGVDVMRVTGPVAVLKSRDVLQYHQAGDVFVARVANEANLKSDVLTLDEEGGATTASALRDLQPKLIFALGPAATQFAQENFATTPIVYAMVPRPQALKLDDNVSGISMNTAPASFFLALQALQPAPRRVGVIHSTDTDSYVDMAKRDAAKFGIEVVTRRATQPSEVGAAFEQMKDKIDALWLIPDATLVSRESFATLVQETSVEKMPLITFSAELVKGGATLAVQPDWEGTGDQAAAQALERLAGTPPAGLTPRFADGRLVINTSSDKALRSQPRPELLACDGKLLSR